jgi:hypothetical protein
MGVVKKKVSLLEKFNAHRADLRASPLCRAGSICLIPFALKALNQGFTGGGILHLTRQKPANYQKR